MLGYLLGWLEHSEVVPLGGRTRVYLDILAAESPGWFKRRASSQLILWEQKNQILFLGVEMQ